MNFPDFHTHSCHEGALELVSAPVRPAGAQYWSLEMHPWYCREIPSDFTSQLANADALGEIGFDRERGALPFPAGQCSLFTAALNAAADLHKAVVIHAVGSFELLFQTVRPYREQMHMLYHGFSRHNPELLAQLVGKGFFVSLSPRVIGDRQIREYCAKNPYHIGLESDDSGIPAEELYERFAVPDFAAQAWENWKEFWNE